MESNKFQISDEQLLDLLDDVPLDPATQDVNTFIKNFSISRGKTPLNKRVLYTLYKGTTRNPVKEHDFRLRMSLHVPTEGSSYLVSDEFFDKAIEVYGKLHPDKQRKKFDKRKSPKFQFQFEKFRKFYNIQKGKDWLEGFVLYHFYDKWVYNESPNYKRPFKKSELETQLKDHFQFKVDRDEVIWFGIDESSLTNISPEQISGVRSGRAWRKNAKKENKKKQG